MLVYCRRRVHLLFFYNGAINLNPIELWSLVWFCILAIERPTVELCRLLQAVELPIRVRACLVLLRRLLFLLRIIHIDSTSVLHLPIPFSALVLSHHYHLQFFISREEHDSLVNNNHDWRVTLKLFNLFQVLSNTWCMLQADKPWQAVYFSLEHLHKSLQERRMRWMWYEELLKEFYDGHVK